MMINMVLNHISNVFPLINAVVIFTGYIEEPGRVWINRGGKGQIQANTIKKGTPAQAQNLICVTCTHKII